MVQPNEEKKVEGTEEPSVKPTALGGLFDLFKSNMGDTLAYILLSGSLLLCFFEPFLGSVPVGLIMGLYFSKRIFQAAKQFREFLLQEGIFHGFIVIASVAALLITAPGLCLGLFIGTFLKSLLGDS